MLPAHPAEKTIRCSDILLPESLEAVMSVIHSRDLFVYPTDTLYGIGGNFLSPETMDKVDFVKNRRDTPYSAAVAGIEMLESLVETIPPIFFDLYKKLLPGKFTFLFKAAPSLDRRLLKNSDRIGIRIPSIPNILKLIERVGVPFISTSVNRSGEPPVERPGEMGKLYPFPLIIDSGILPPSRGSTILDITVNPIKCIRKGDDFHKLQQLNINTAG
jgi:L-threonylcarbamoyladenylate synthase